MMTDSDDDFILRRKKMSADEFAKKHPPDFATQAAERVRKAKEAREKLNKDHEYLAYSEKTRARTGRENEARIIISWMLFALSQNEKPENADKIINEAQKFLDNFEGPSSGHATMPLNDVPLDLPK